MAEEFFTWLQREKRLELSAQQRQAVETTEGAVLLTATPGSGKTTVIVCRTAYLLREKKIPAGQILTLTFGKQSQLDMDRRFAALFPEMEKPRFSTLHALSLSILRRYCEITGGAMFSLLPDSAPVVRELLRKQINGFISEELLRNALSALECEAVQTGKHTAQSVEGCDMEQLLQDYALYKRERRLMDFSDLLRYADRALERVPALLAELQTRYPYVQIDEAQDTSPIQQRIAGRIAQQTGNLFLVGDEDQSIYGFRGAQPDILMKFESDHPGATILFLETNYRSCPEIVAAAGRVIQFNAYRRIKQMHAAEESKPGLVEKIELRDWNAQGEYVAQRAKALASGKTLGVLFRNGDSLPALADALQKAGVPFVRSRRDGLPPLFTSPAMRALRAAIKLSFNPCDIDSFRILKNRIKKDLPNYIVNQIAAADEDVFEGIEGRVSLSRGELESLERKRKAVAGYKKLRALPAVSAIIDDFYLDGRGGVNQKTDALLSLAMGVETVDDYIAKLNEMEVFLSSENAGHGRVFLSTIHAAKGLENDEVILCDGRAGILPQHDSVDTPEDRREREEETRLMYVAVTRARERFSFLCASHSHGAAAPASLYLGRIFPPIGRRPVQSAPVRTFHSGFTPVSPGKNSTAPLLDFTGKRVVHKKFGQGDVLKVEKGAALIRFADGEKRIDLRAALDCGAISPAGD